MGRRAGGGGRGEGGGRGGGGVAEGRDIYDSIRSS